MANKTLFKSLIGKLVPATDAINEERAPAYALCARAQLAQYAATGCLNTTFYATADEQLAKVLELCADLDAEFIAKTAVFCRERGFMKDMPALLCAVLSVKDRELLNTVFPRVIDNAKMLRNFVQIMRSGAVGRKSLGSAPRRVKHCSVISSAANTRSMRCRTLLATSKRSRGASRVTCLMCHSRC